MILVLFCLQDLLSLNTPLVQSLTKIGRGIFQTAALTTSVFFISLYKKSGLQEAAQFSSSVFPPLQLLINVSHPTE
ncbi:hypothetical protein K491DRAFT_692891 [Lophiostoma macrostomum CBS 122681]|uniref:Uncharacterized protein n=1 Tax=Lophiostoma macrostomum CBS 122681 TaxID=1314788 RepID=A0A6A6T6F2_9PLEO|nr:hypothetical protein K491DRAFT_692891 [Lophiostoma macrostomum CBS 122681]